MVILVILLLLRPERYSPFDAEFNFGISILFFVSMVFYLLQQRKYTSNWLRFDVIFLIGFFIVHFQIPFFASIGIEPATPDFVWINKRVVNFATWMSAVSVVLWMWGYTIYSSKRPSIKNRFKNSNFKVSLYKFDIILLVVFLLFLVLVGPALFQGAYDGGKNWGNGAVYIFLVLRVLLCLRIIYFFKDFQNKTSFAIILKKFLTYKIFLGVLGLYTLLFLLSGDRGPVMQVGLIVGGAYALYIRPISLARLTLFLLIGAFLFTVIRFGRGQDVSQFDNSNIFERGYSAYNEQSDDVNITYELATSVRIQYRALSIVPDAHPYLYGITFFTVGVGTLPFFGSSIINLFDIPQPYTATSNFFTYLGQGRYATYGEGSEILGDIYVNFGLYGTFIIMFLFGMFSGNMFTRAYNLEFNFVLVFLVLLMYSLTINRGMLFSPLKDIVYILAINQLLIRFAR